MEKKGQKKTNKSEQKKIGKDREKQRKEEENRGERRKTEENRKGLAGKREAKREREGD